METELVSDLSSVHGVGQILLVGEDEEEGVPKFVLVQHALQLLTCLGYTLPIVGVDDENDTLGVLEVCMMQFRAVLLRAEESHAQCLQRGRILSWPPTSHTVNEMFLYSTVSTLKPLDSIHTISPCRTRQTTSRLTNSGDGGDDFTELELVEDGGLTSGIKTNLQS